MSYVRFTVDGSQVYIYEDVRGYVVCCLCVFSGASGPDFHTRDLDAMLDHVATHRSAGYVVPEWVEDSLREDWPTEWGVTEREST